MGAGMIRQGDPSHFDVVFRRNPDFRLDFQVASALAKLSLGLRKGRLVTFSRTQRRLISSRTEFSGRAIAHINESYPAIARRILPPTRDYQDTQAAVCADSVSDSVVTSGICKMSNC